MYGRIATEVIIPNGVQKIPSYAFCNCSCLISISIPDSVTTIESYVMKCYSGIGTFTFVTETDCFKKTKTTISDDGKAFDIKCGNIANGNTVFLHNNGKFIEMQSEKYNGADISFTTDKIYTSAKVMVLESLNIIKPVCNVEAVKIN